jgi:hypothetical protein
MINVRKDSFIRKLASVCFLGVCASLLLISHTEISQGADYPPIPAPSLTPAPLPSATPAPLPSNAPGFFLPEEPGVVSAPIQIVVVKPNEKPAAPPVAVAPSSPSQVTVDGKFVTLEIAPQNNPSPGTVGVTVSGEDFNFSLSTTSTDGGDSTIGSVTIIDGKPVINIPQQTTIATTGTGFKPNDKVSLYVFSKAKFLGNITTSDIGEFNANVTLPNLPVGPHHFQATGLTKDGKIRTITLFMNISPEVINKVSAKSPIALMIFVAISLLLVLLLFWIFLLKKRKTKTRYPI